MALPQPVIKRIKSFEDTAVKVPGFFKSLFMRDPESDSKSDKIEIHIRRNHRQIMPGLPNFNEGTPGASRRKWTKKTFETPIVGLHDSFDKNDLLQTGFDETQYDASDGKFMARLLKLMIRGWDNLYTMHQYTTEYMAAQVMQTGALNMLDENGATVFELDFEMRASHILNVATAWSDPAADIIGDLQGASDTLKKDGFATAKFALMGMNAYISFLSNTAVKERYLDDRMKLGELNPSIQPDGTRYMGTVDINNNKLSILTYTDYFEEFGGSDPIEFMDPDKVIIMPGKEAMDLRWVYGGIPIIGASAPPFSQMMPRSLNPDGVVIKPRIYHDQKVDNIITEIMSRPLPVPVGIDQFMILITT